MERENRPRPSLRALRANWRNSDLPFLRRLWVAAGNYARRWRIPPRDCCGRPGQPGC